MNWVERLLRFSESLDPDNSAEVRENREFGDGILRSIINGQSCRAGFIDRPGLDSMREEALQHLDRRMSPGVHERVGDVPAIHLEPDDADAFSRHRLNLNFSKARFSAFVRRGSTSLF